MKRRFSERTAGLGAADEIEEKDDKRSKTGVAASAAVVENAELLREEEKKEETLFEARPGLLIGKLGLDAHGCNSSKVAAFDMDWTLIKTKMGNKFAKNAHDWELWHEKVATKLRRLVADGFRIVVFTNQGGVATGKRTV